MTDLADVVIVTGRDASGRVLVAVAPESWEVFSQALGCA